MTAMELAAQLGVPFECAEDYLSECTRVVESSQHVAVLKGNQVHIGAKVTGLGGRKMLLACQETLKQWFDLQPVLYAPIRHGNARAVRLADACGFRLYYTDATYWWMTQTKEQFHAKPH